MGREPLETGDMMVVTVEAPTTSAQELSVEVAGHQVTILGPGGFRHALTLRAAADPARLHAALYRGFLELRAPRGVAEGTVVRRTVQVESRS
jgi:HSP20 family molecular chaperone IbpA